MDTSRMKPTRILILMQNSSRHWLKTDAEVIDAALELISQQDLDLNNVTFTAKDYRFIAKEMWGMVTFFIVDLFHHDYNPETSHKEGENNLPLIVVRFSKKKETALQENQAMEVYVNQRLRQLHDDEGYGSEPPFFVDHRDGKVPSYPSPRTSVCSSPDPSTSAASAPVGM